MSDQATTITAADATPPASPETASPASATATQAPDATAALRAALVRAQVASVLGPVAAPWVLDAALTTAAPDLLDDFSGLTPKSKERLAAWRSQNAFAFQGSAAAPAQTQGAAVPTTQPTTQAAQTEPLPATPASSTGATSGLSTDQLRRLGQIHVDPNNITKHNDWPRVKAFWGVA